MFAWDSNNLRFQITAYGDTPLICRPKLKRGEVPPLHRFTDLANPSEYTQPQFIESEDDVLHMWELPDFGELDVGHARALGQHDAELLLSYLTAPYLRVPLVVSFFASDDRVHSLQAPKLQALLDAVLFQPGNHLPLDKSGLEPVDVPTSAPSLLGTPHHLLLNELIRSPDTLLGGVTQAAPPGDRPRHGDAQVETATVILYVTRLACRIDNYVSFLLQYDGECHDSIVGKPYRAVDLAAEIRARLSRRARGERSLLWGEVRGLLHAWSHVAGKMRHADPASDPASEPRTCDPAHPAHPLQVRACARVVLQARARVESTTTPRCSTRTRGTCARSTPTCC